MALISYRQRECETCGGPLEYHADKKEYVCKYCGNRYEKTESYDGQFSVRHAALQALSAIARRNCELAEDNLNDCQKIDPAYPGSIIARMSYCLLRAGIAQAEGDGLASANYINQAIDQYRKLPSSFDEIACDTEADFYESIDSEDVRSLLITNFNLMKDETRAQRIDEAFDPSKVHGDATNALVREMRQGDWAAVDALIGAQGRYDVDAFLPLLLDSYPNCEQKARDVSIALARGADGTRMREALSRYVAGASDDVGIRAAVISAFAERGIAPQGEAVANWLASGPDQGEVNTIVSATCTTTLSDDDAEAIVESALAHLDAASIENVIAILAGSESFISYQVSALTSFFTRADQTSDDKVAVYRCVAANGLTNKKKQALFGELLNASVPISEKRLLADVIGTDIGAINPTLIERYLLHSTVDGAGKADLVSELVKHVPARESLAYAAKRYASSGTDSPEAKNKVIAALAREGLIERIDDLGGTLEGDSPGQSVETARGMKEAGVGVGPTALNDYLGKTLGTSEYSGRVFDELYIPQCRISRENFIRFLFDAPDEQGKAERAAKLARALTGTLADLRIKADTPSGSFEGPLLHAYLLKTTDGAPTVNAIGGVLLETARKPNCEVTLNGSTKKFKKFVSSGQVQLSEPAAAFWASMRKA